MDDEHVLLKMRTVNHEPFVLVKFPDLLKTPYSIVTADHWEKWQVGREDNVHRWREVARGTEAEMEALALLMPDPKVINRSSE